MDNGIFTCHVCGSKEYNQESGFYYCKECQTQSQEVREEIFEENEEAAQTSKIQRAPRSDTNYKVKRNGEEFTSWEVYNLILKGQVDELQKLGASPALKYTVLQLWSHYLNKLEVAFICKKSDFLPRLGPGYYTRDASLVYGIPCRRVSKRKRSRSSKTNDSSSTISTSSHTSSMHKQRMRKSKKLLMMRESEKNTSDAETNILSTLDQTLSGDESTGSANTSVHSRKVAYSKAARKSLQRSRKLNSKNTNIGNCRLLHYTDPNKLSRFKLVLLLYLGLLYTGNNIRISDLIRWIREEHLSYYQVLHLLPGSCHSSIDVRVFGQSVYLPSYSTFLKSASSLATFLNVVDWPTPNVSDIAKKYVTELHLPYTLIHLVEKFVKLVPLSILWHTTGIPNYEGRVLAIIIIILKLLLGLDGKTENCISITAQKINTYIKEGDHPELFVWIDWVQYTTCCNAVLIKHHFPTQDSVFPEMLGNPYLFIKHCKAWKESNGGQSTSYISKNGVSQDILNSIEDVLRKLSAASVEDDGQIKFPATLTPHSTYINCIMDAWKADGYLGTLQSKKILSQDFSSKDMEYLLNKKVLKTLSAKYNFEVLVKVKSAQSKVQKPQKFPIEQKRKNLKKAVNVVILPNDDIPIGNSKRGKRKNANQKQDQQAKQSCKSNKRKNVNQKQDPWVKQSCKFNKRKNVNLKQDSRVKQSCKSTKRKNVNRKQDARVKQSSKSSEEAKTSSGHKQHDRLLMYRPFSQYWVYRGPWTTFTEEEFLEEASLRFPTSFLWLLSQCALLSEMSLKTLYEEVVTIESICYDSFSVL